MILCFSSFALMRFILVDSDQDRPETQQAYCYSRHKDDLEY